MHIGAEEMDRSEISRPFREDLWTGVCENSEKDR